MQPLRCLCLKPVDVAPASVNSCHVLVVKVNRSRWFCIGFPYVLAIWQELLSSLLCHLAEAFSGEYRNWEVACKGKQVLSVA